MFNEMSRKKRDAMFDELEEVIKKGSKMMFGEMMAYYDDEEREAMEYFAKTLKLSSQCVEYAKFQAHQIDKIEDKQDRILEVLKKIERKGGC